jgi:hypothetical protein
MSTRSLPECTQLEEMIGIVMGAAFCFFPAFRACLTDRINAFRPSDDHMLSNLFSFKAFSPTYSAEMEGLSQPHWHLTKSNGIHEIIERGALWSVQEDISYTDRGSPACILV